MTLADLAEMDADDLVMALLDIPQPENPYLIYQRLREIGRASCRERVSCCV